MPRAYGVSTAWFFTRRSLLHPALPPPHSLRSGIGACYDKTTAVMTRADDLKPDPYNTPQVHTMYTPINKLLMQGVVDSWIRLSASLAVWAFCLTVTACAGVEHKDTLPTVASVDLARYAGTWYEIARLPMWFQRHCVDSKAIYTSRPDGRIGDHNECLTDSGGVDQAEGVATVIDPKTNARLTVVFDNFFARLFGSSRDGNYWILALDPEYRTALVGTPDRRFLWILSRAPQLEEVTYQRLVEQAKDLGFPIRDLIRTRRPTSL